MRKYWKRFSHTNSSVTSPASLYDEWQEQSAGSVNVVVTVRQEALGRLREHWRGVWEPPSRFEAV